MWAKMMTLGVTALTTVCATSACGFAEEQTSLEAETGAAELAEQQFCGGIAGIRCPDGYTCIDDPSDSCDPNHDGADCGGVCVVNASASDCSPDPTKEYLLWDPTQCAAARFFCEGGSQAFFDECGCGCQTG